MTTSEDNTTEKAAPWHPTTAQVREGYSIDPEDEYRDPINAPANRRANERYFDTWLAAHDAEVLASRDAEVAVLREENQRQYAIQESLTIEILALRERVAELEAAVQKAHAICDIPMRVEVMGSSEAEIAMAALAATIKREALDAPPSEVLAAVRREAAAEGAASALEDVAHEWGNKTWLQVLTQSLVTRAAEIRAGGNQ